MSSVQCGPTTRFYESTVYRTLDRLVELAVVERVQIRQGATIFHLPHRPHYHLVCEHWGDVAEVPADLLHDLAKVVVAEHGFALRPSACTLVGSCRRCAARVGPRHDPGKG